jgi:hypothetical protein
MRFVKIFIFLLLALIIKSSPAQDWIRIYTNQGWGLAPRGLIESYDNGYLILCDASNYKLSLILKTDVNGYERFRKFFGANSYQIIPESIEQTLDFGYIIAGSMSKYGSNDAYVLKLNSCFEKEWCKVLQNDNYYGVYGQDVKQLPDGGYVLLTRYYNGIDPGQRINLHRLDHDGELLWQNNFADNDSLLFGEEGLNLLIINENEYLITGYGYYPDFGQTGGWRRPLLIKVDSTGNDHWETIWGADDYFYGRPWYNSIVDHSGNIYNLGYRVGFDARYPVLFKTKNDGQELFYSDLVDTCYEGDAALPTWMEDSLIFANIGWWNWDQSLFWGFFKIDTIGNIIDFKDISDPLVAVVSIVRTFDNKYLNVGIYNNEALNRWEIYAYKLNSDLEYDTLYTTPFVYDSLCPYEITSDTTDIDCDILVLLDEQYLPLDQVPLTVYPNPARDRVTISYPDVSRTGHREIIIFNNLGIEVKRIRLTQGDEETVTDISNFPSGIYFMTVLDNGKRIVSAKMLVAR